ncbi:interleukin-21 isoform X2 [Aquarana catesbeiana]
MELQKALSPITRHANKTHPQSFHVPVDVTQNCLDSALICFRSQVLMLQEATGRNVEAQRKVSFESLLKKVKLNKLVDQKDCTPCRNYSTHTPSEFLEKMNSLLQKIIFVSGDKS